MSLRIEVVKAFYHTIPAIISFNEVCTRSTPSSIMLFLHHNMCHVMVRNKRYQNIPTSRFDATRWGRRFGE